MILLNLYGISIDNHFYLFLSRMVHPTKSFTSMGLAHSCPKKTITRLPGGYIPNVTLVPVLGTLVLLHLPFWDLLYVWQDASVSH